MLDCKMILPIVREGLVEGAVLFWGDVLRIPGPDGLLLVKLFLLNLALLDLLCLLLFLLFFIIYLLDLRLLLIILIFFLLGLLIRDLFFDLLHNMEVNGI